jgi:GNAT superfamily N-acetyltransferase
MMIAVLVAGRFATTGAENRTYKRDQDGRFSSGFGSKGSPRDLADSDETIKRELTYDDEQTGVRMSVHEVDRSHGEPIVTMHLTDRVGEKVGEIVYTLYQRGERGDAGFSMARVVPEAQGQGIGTRAQRHIEETLRAYGNEKITGNAALSNGGFAWARQGWDFEDSAARMDVRERATYVAKAMKMPKTVQAEVARVVKMTDSTPADFAEIGFEPGATEWPGKTIMRGSVWGMVKRLDT